jgi:hypothetical protein
VKDAEAAPPAKRRRCRFEKATNDSTAKDIEGEAAGKDLHNFEFELDDVVAS